MHSIGRRVSKDGRWNRLGEHGWSATKCCQNDEDAQAHESAPV
jgi:hypothetical protein